MKKSLSLLFTFIILFSVFTSVSIIPASAATHLACVKQNDAIWKDYYYNEGNLYDTGCGIFSLVNAVGYLTGLRMSVTEAASWAYSINAFNVTDSEGTYRTTLYPNVEKKYGSAYGFTLDCSTGTGYWAGSSSATLKNHLTNGGVAVGHVPGHFIAIVGYDSSENKFHVYDSYATNGRGTNTNGGDVWVTQSQFATGQLCLDWFCLLTATGNAELSGVSQNHSTGVYTTDGELKLYSNASDTSNILATVPFNTLVSVVSVSDGRGFISYNGKSGYIRLSGATRVGDLPTPLYPIGVYETTSDLNLRVVPSADGTLLTTIPKGTTIFVTEVSNLRWGYTSYTGFDGYINLNYAVRTGDLPVSANSTLGKYTVSTDINMRSASAYGSSVVTVIPANTVFTVTKVSSGWGYTEYNSYTGWVNLAYASYVGSLEEDDIILGDVDGDGIVTILDATVIQRVIAKLTDLNDKQMKAADTDADGTVTVLDTTQIQRFVAHIVDSFK